MNRIIVVLLFTAGCLVRTPGTSMAVEGGGHVKLTVDVGAAEAADRCKDVQIESAAGSQDVDFKVAVIKGKTALDSQAAESKELSFALKAKEAVADVPLTVSTELTQNLELSGPKKLSEYEGATLTVRKGGNDFCTVALAAGAKTQVALVDCDKLLKASMKGAQKFIDTSKNTENDLTIHEIPSPWWHRGRVFIVSLLPNGAPSGRLPDDLSERDKLDLVMVVPANAIVAPPTVTCNAPPLWRNLNTIAAPGASETHGAETGVPDSEFIAVYYPSQGHGCENSLDVSTQVTFPGCAVVSVTQKIPTQKVYDYLLGAGFGYDFGSPADYSSETSKSSTAAMPQKVLVRNDDATGLKPIVTLSFYPFGANPNSWRIDRDTWAPFVGLDPTRVTKGAYVGFNLQPFGPTFGLLTGVSIFESEKLKSPVGLEPGDVVTGEIETRSAFNSDGVGFFLGLNATTEAIQQLFSAGARAFGANSTGTGATP